MVDRKAFRTLSSGLFLITSRYGGDRYGCVVNTFQQVASTPPTVSVAINKENATTQAVLESGRFVATVLAQDAPMEIIGTFGFHTSTEIDKFENYECVEDLASMPYVSQHGLARFSVKVTEKVDVGTHYVFFGLVEEAEVLAEGEPLTYAYYHAVKGGKTPPKAATYNPLDSEEAAPASASAEGGAPKYAWRCTICGYIENMEELPDDYMCPICGATKDMFERIEL